MENDKKPNTEKEKINHTGPLTKLDDIKSKYILQKIFYIMHKRKALQLIQYNKNSQEKLNFSIQDFNKLSKIYSSIEIELIPVNNKYGQFINILKSEEKKYFHIYFNNDKNEIKRYSIKKDEKITKIKIIINYQVESFRELFYGFKCIESIYFKKFIRNNINDMSHMFNWCSSLKKINILNCNTNNVTNMSWMFNGCSSLEDIDLSNFNTKNVKNMNSMFCECTSLKVLNLSNFDTKKVIDMSFMFYKCTSLKEIDISNFDTKNVFYSKNMFSKCKALTEIKLPHHFINGESDIKNIFNINSKGLKVIFINKSINK